MSITNEIVPAAGVNALSGERGLPSVKDIPGLQLKALHAEHAVIETADPLIPITVGEKIEIDVRYHDGTVHLHQRMYEIRNGLIEKSFKASTDQFAP